MAASATAFLYKDNPDVDECTFAFDLMSYDNYGKEKYEPIFAYSFNRALYKRINWDKFSSKNLASVASHFEAGRDVISRSTMEGKRIFGR